MSVWAVWEDPSDGCVYASYSSTPERQFNQRRLWELRADGDAREISNAELSVPPTACAIEALGNLSKPTKLAIPAVVSLNDEMYARSGDEVWVYNKTASEWMPAIPTPRELVKLKGGGLAIRDE